VSRSGISPFFVAALLTREDGSFYRHGGFSVSSIRDALVRNLKEGRFVYGASTITMQLAKNLFLQRQKTLARKAQEVFLTWMLERLLSKDDIITLYANIVEYGRSLYGIRAAARRYFGRSAAGLSPAEATFLACILSRPKVYHGQLFAGELSGSMRSRMDRVLRRMGSRGRISPEEMAWGLAELPSFGFRVDGAPMREPWSPPLDEPQAEGDATTDGDPLPGDPERPPRPVGDEAPAVDDGSWEPNAWELGGPSAER
jgi:membrane peptidoglycan carboxypeptidase